MKKQFIYSILSLSLLAACSSIEDETKFPSQEMDRHENALQIEIGTSDFIVDGNTETRAADQGKETLFEEGDKVGIIILENNQPIEANNLPYVYDGKDWSYDEATVESEESGKKLYYNNAAATNVTYIVYYPYSANADEAKSVDELKASFAWQEDQSTEAAYRATDLMVWTNMGAPMSKLNVTLSHVYSAFSISVGKAYELTDGKSTICPLTMNLSGMTIMVGDKTIKPFMAEDGSFRCILTDGYSGNVRWKYVADKKSYAGTKTVAGVANTRYLRVETIRLGTYDLSKVENGDFYCVKDNKGYLVPQMADKEFLKTVNCVGVVFYKGSDLNKDNYGLLGEKHGLAVALQDATLGGNAKMNWAYAEESDVSTWLKNSTWTGGVARPNDFTSITDISKRQGYANTLALKEFNREEANSGKKNKLVEALAEFAASHTNLPTETSGWYCPSLGEIKTMGRGQGNEGTYENEVSGKKLLNGQLQKITGAVTIADEDYWSCSEKEAKKAYNFYFKSCWFGDGGSNKNTAAYKLRPVFAF